MALSRDTVVERVTTDYLNALNINHLPSPKTIQGELLEELSLCFEAENQIRPKAAKWRIPDALSPAQIADILIRIHRVINVVCGGPDASRECDMLAIYVDTGENCGIYSTDIHDLEDLIQQYRYDIPDKLTKEVIVLLSRKAPRKWRSQNPNLVAVHNGIFDYETKSLRPFTPDEVFITKSRIDFKQQVTNPVIHNNEDNTDWDVESWMSEFFDDAEMTELLWQIVGATLRPNVHWDVSAWFYSTVGNNGKGTLCSLMRNLAGTGACTSISLDAFSKDFMLEPLTKATAIVVDENDVGTFIDKAANLKAVITGDAIQINRKYMKPITFHFQGFMVQCLNEFPRIRDKSDSFYRRQLFVPFNKSFTGAERKYIKHDYLKRQDVLEYVLYRILMMDYQELNVPSACQYALEEYKEFNDPIRQFLNEMLPLSTWDLLPTGYLYQLYTAWYKLNVGPSGVEGKNMFIHRLRTLVDSYPEWMFDNQVHRSSGLMNKPEPLIAEYGLTEWMNPQYMSSPDVNKKCMPLIKERYRGLMRMSSTILVDQNE